jgi:hypothetical protein
VSYFSEQNAEELEPICTLHESDENAELGESKVSLSDMFPISCGVSVIDEGGIIVAVADA